MNGMQKTLSNFLLDRRTRNVSPGSIQFYQDKLGTFLSWCESESVVEVEDLSAAHLRAFLVWLDDEGHNPGGRHAFYRSVRAFLNFYEAELDEAWRNPIRKVAAPKVKDEPLEPVPTQEVLALLAACGSDFYGVRDSAILLFLLETGVRASELVGLDVSDLDLPNGFAQVRHGKGGKVRTVVMGERVQKEIRKWLRIRPSVGSALFTKRGGARITYGTLRGILQRRAEEAGVEGVTLHSFRRAFCLSQLQAGTPETTIARLMGHVNTQLIARYAKQTSRHLRESFYSVVDQELTDTSSPPGV